MLFFHLFESFLFFISMPDLHHSHLALSEKMSCNVVLCRVMSQSNVIVLNGEKLFLQSQKALPGGGSPMRGGGSRYFRAGCHLCGARKARYFWL